MFAQLQDLMLSSLSVPAPPANTLRCLSLGIYAPIQGSKRLGTLWGLSAWDFVSFPWVVHYLLHLICMSEVIRFPREAVEPGALCLLPARTPQEVGSHYSLPYPLCLKVPNPSPCRGPRGLHASASVEPPHFSPALTRSQLRAIPTAQRSLQPSPPSSQQHHVSATTALLLLWT